jgi:hypothetical protein
VKTETLPDIIEIIDDGIDPFGDRSSNTTITDTGGPRWVGPVAAAALVALIGYGIATTAASSGVPDVAPAPTTIAAPPTTHAVPTTTTLPAQLVPYYAADLPREYRVSSAEFQGSDQPIFHRGDYQLWAAPDATASSGSWFSIESLRVGPQSVTATNAYRVEAGDQSIAISHIPGGQTITQTSLSKVMSITITSFGWSDADLVRLAQSVIVSDNSVGNDVEVNDPALISNYQMISTVQPWLAVQGIPVEQVYYTAGEDPAGFLALTVAPRLPPTKSRSALDRQVALRFFLDHTTTFEVDGHEAIAGSLVGAAEQSVASWVAGDHIVTMAAQLPVEELVTLAGTVHQVSSSEWAGMRFQASRNANQFNGDLTEQLPRPASFGTSTDGHVWESEVGAGTFGTQLSVNWQWGAGGGGFGSTGTANATIDTVVDTGLTYVLAQLPRAIAAEAQLQVTLDGLAPVLVPFTDIDATYDRTFAAYAFSEPTNYSAQIIANDGTVLASWPSA